MQKYVTCKPCFIENQSELFAFFKILKNFPCFGVEKEIPEKNITNGKDTNLVFNNFFTKDSR